MRRIHLRVKRTSSNLNMKSDKKTPKKKTAKAKTEGVSVVDEKVFDVARPGESMPSSSGRPLIISHKPGISHDPMVSSPDAGEPKESDKENNSDDSETVEIVTTEKIMKAPKKNRIEPLSTTITIEDAETTEASDETLDAEEVNEDTTKDTEDVPVADVKNDETDDISDEIEDVSATVTTKKQAQDEEAKKQAQELEKQSEIEKLIENKHFFVPINAAQKRRSRRVIIFVGLLLIIVVGVLAALDAEIFDIGVDPFTNFL